MSTNISAIGNKVKVVLDSTVNGKVLYPFKQDISLAYDQNANTIDLKFNIGPDKYSYMGIPIANILINEVAITSQVVFDAQVSTLFSVNSDAPFANSKIALAGVGINGAGADNINYSNKGVVVVVDVTAISGTSPTLTVTIEGKDEASNKYYTILTSAPITAVSTNVLTIYPGNKVTANISESTVIPKTWRISYTVGGTTPSITATIGSCTIS